MDCYVYLHRKKTDGEIFYIGKGRGKRAWKKTQRSDWWKRIEAKHGRDVEIVLRGLTDEQAYDLERGLIEWVGLDNLCNLRDGGSGGFAMKDSVKEHLRKINKGRFVSQETREKMRIAATGFRHSEETKERLREIGRAQSKKPATEETRKKLSEALRGRRFTDEHRSALSAARKGVPTGRPMPAHVKEMLVALASNRTMSQEQKDAISARNKGARHTQEARLKMSAASKASNKPKRKPVACSNGMIFEYSVAAAEWLRDNGHPSASRANIASCCNGKLKSAYGFVWTHANPAMDV